MSDDLKLSMPLTSESTPPDVRRRKGSKTGGNPSAPPAQAEPQRRRVDTVATLDTEGENDGCCTCLLLVLSYIGMIVLFPLVVCQMIVQVMVRRR